MRTLSSSSRRRVPIIRSQIAFARGALGGLVRIWMPSAAKTASNASVNRESRSSEQELDRGGLVADVHHEVAGGLSGPRPVGCAVTPSRCAQREPCSTAIIAVNRLSNTVSTCTKSTARTALACALRTGARLGPRPPRCRIEASVVQDLRHRGGGDAMTEPDQLTLHTDVPR
jgi:hypothetical protein